MGEGGRGARELTPLPKSSSWLMSRVSFVVEGEEGSLSNKSSEGSRDPYEEFLHRFLGPEPDI